MAARTITLAGAVIAALKFLRQALGFLKPKVGPRSPSRQSAVAEVYLANACRQLPPPKAELPRSLPESHVYLPSPRSGGPSRPLKTIPK